MRDPKTEQFLSRGNWKWDYVDRVPFAEIDIEKSRDNPSRLLRALDDDRALSYGLAMQDGAEFPAIVLLTLDPAASAFKYLIATGVHRVAAAQLSDIAAFDAYVVVEPDLYRQEVLIRQLNTIEGQGVSIRDRINQILLLHDAYPDRSLSSLAKEWNLKYQTVKSAAVEQEAIKRARRFGFEFNKGNKLSQKSLLALHQVRSDPVFQKALHYVVLNGVGSTEVEDVVRDIKKTRDDVAGAAVVERYAGAAADRQLQAQAKHGRISLAAAPKFMADARRLMNHLDRGIENLHFAAYPRRDLAVRLIEDLIDNLKRLAADISRIERIEKTPVGASPAVH